MEILPMKKCITDEQVEKKRQVILAKFSNGYLKLPNKSPLEFISYESSLNRSLPVLQKILVAKTNRLCYFGSNSENYASKITSSVLKVCILNKKNSSIELYDATLFYLKPFKKCSEIFHSRDTRSFIEKHMDLTLEFGSKAKKRSINSKLKYDSQVDSGHSLEGFIAGSEETKLQNEPICVSTESTASVIPPQNKTALSPTEVYNIWDKYDALESNAEIFLTAKREDIQLWKEEKRYSPFIIEYMVNKLTSINLHAAKLVAYLHYMLCFLTTTYADWRRKDPVPGVPEPFKQKLMDSFTVKKSMPQRMKDKLFSYAAVIALMLHNYTFDGSSLALSAKVPNKRLVSIAYALGCHVSENKNNGRKIIQLKLPLFKYSTAPKQKRNK